MWCKVRKQYKHQTGGAISSGQSQLCDLDAFVEGTTNIKRDTATSHNGSQMHKAAVKAAQQAVAEESGSAPVIVRQLTVMSDAAKDKMVKLFDIAYTVAKCEQPFTLFPTLVAMEKRHGVLLGDTYQNDVACPNFVGHIAGSMKEDLQKSFDEEPFYCSLLFDGSTDIGYIREGSPQHKDDRKRSTENKASWVSDYHHDLLFKDDFDKSPQHVSLEEEFIPRVYHLTTSPTYRGDFFSPFFLFTLDFRPGSILVESCPIV